METEFKERKSGRGMKTKGAAKPHRLLRKAIEFVGRIKTQNKNNKTKQTKAGQGQSGRAAELEDKLSIGCRLVIDWSVHLGREQGPLATAPNVALHQVPVAQRVGCLADEFQGLMHISTSTKKKQTNKQTNKKERKRKGIKKGTTTSHIRSAVRSKDTCRAYFLPFHSKVQKSTFSQPSQRELYK